MRILIEGARTKLCHARPGDLVQLSDYSSLYLVCMGLDEKGAKKMRSGMTQGLYDEGRCLFLVNVQTGRVKEMPNLSTRVMIRTDLAIMNAGLPSEVQNDN